MTHEIEIPAIVISLLSILCVCVLIAGFRRGMARAIFPWAATSRTTFLLTLVAVAWAVVVGILAKQGFFSNFAAMPPRLLIALVVPAIALAIAMLRSSTLPRVLANVPISWLLYLQVFRVLVELMLWRGYKLGNLPLQMTFEGRNFDIIAGLTAPLAGWIWQRTRSRAFGIGWNVAGLTLLANIIVVALLSMPTHFRVFMDGPANTLLTQFPFIYLPAILVPIAYTAHILSLRQLLNRPKSSIAD